MKPRLIILSDLWGKQKSDWVNHYINELKSEYAIQYYDCCELGDIDLTDYSEEALHKQFIQGGIERAVAKLTSLEKGTMTILAFSIGGTIAWKYAQQTGRVDKLFCLSSTRLRYEVEKPKADIKLWYGVLDRYQPKADWFDKMQVEYQLLKGQKHDFYTDISVVKLISEALSQG